MESDQSPQNPAGQPFGQPPASVTPPTSPVPPETPQPSTPPPSGFGPQPISASDLKKKSSRRLGKAGIIAIAVAVLLTGSAGAYFGLMLPNKPENIWKKALSNTSKGYERLISYAEENKEIKGMKAKGSLKLEGAFAGDGTLEAESYEGNSKLKADFGFAGARFTVDALATMPENSQNPDLYFRVGGIKGIGGLLGGSEYKELGPFIDSLDKQWISVDHTLFDQLNSAAGAQTAQPLSDDDAFAIARAIGEVNSEYLLSTDKDKRVLTVVKEVGKEKRDDRSMYRFEIGVDKDNLKDYMTALKDKLKETKLKDAVGEKAINDYFDAAITSLEQQKQEDFDTTVDVWVDMKTKLIRIIRFTDDKEDENYVEIGLAYDGGDDYPFFIDFQFPKDTSAPGSGRLSATINTEKDTVKMEMKLDFGGEVNEKVTGELLIEPNDQPVDVQKPDGAKPIMEVIGGFLGGIYSSPSPSGGSTQFPTQFPTSNLLRNQLRL